MLNDMLNSRISGIRVEVTIHIKMVINGCQFCSELDLLWIGCLESTLGGHFGTRSCALNMFLYWRHFHISHL
jgi:hypothetical protein